MKIGVPMEKKDHEKRVGMTPDGVHSLTDAGHTVVLERGAGVGSGFTDDDYVAAGAQLGSADDAWACELVVKVKEPIPSEYQYLRDDLTLFCYLHLAAEPELAQALRDAGTTAIAFETVTDPQGGLPLLTPMSEIAGRLSVQIGAYLLTNPAGGPGVLLGGIGGVAPINVTVIGGGTSGAQAVDVAVGLGAHVTVIDINTATLRRFMERYQGRVHCVSSSPAAIAEALSRSHLVIGAVLVPGAKAPIVITSDHIKNMPPGSVIVDIAIDQGGCTEESRPTSHSEPVFTVDGVSMYCVTNMPGSAQVTATKALAAETLPFIQQIATHGTEAALAANPHLMAGVNIAGGEIVHESVKNALC
ncbi:MAG: alanine dehydrogenase [Corynebacterium sp.]|nr:alanine dehydrogenase [Corynebacterium sp.]